MRKHHFILISYSLIVMSKFSKFFGSSWKDFEKEPKVEQAFTLMLVPDVEDDKNPIKTICLELQNDPYAALSFDDFTIEKLLRAGVSLKPLNVKSDIRIGSDEQIKAFNDKLEMFADKLYNFETV